MSQHLIFKPCMVTICMHDYAVRKNSRKAPPISIQEYQEITIETANEMTDVQLGQILRRQLKRITEAKREVEQNENPYYTEY